MCKYLFGNKYCLN